MRSIPESLLKRFHQHFLADPNRCVTLGVDENLGALPNPSSSFAQAQIKSARELQRKFGELDTSNYAFEAQLDVDLAKLWLGRQAHDLGLTVGETPQCKLLPKVGDGISDGLVLLFLNDPRPAGERLENITSRLEGVPEFCAATLQNLERPHGRWSDIDAEKCSPLPQLFENLQAWAKHENYAGQARLAKASAAASEALESYRQALQSLPKQDGFALGESQAAEVVAHRGIELSLEDLRQVAANFLADTQAQLEELRQELTKKYELAADTSTAELHSYLNKRYAVKVADGRLESILDRYQAERGRILDFIRERNLFPIPDDQEMQLLRTPGYLAPSIPAGAMVCPPPFRTGQKTSMVYLTLSEELLDEHTELGIPLMMVHEGIPGHHLQLTWAAMHRSVIRKHIDAMDLAEGWTTMLEGYMLDVGYVQDVAKEARFCGLRDLSRIGARVAIDLAFMTGNLDYLRVGGFEPNVSGGAFEEAGKLLQLVTGFTDGRVQAELNWYSYERGYPLSYLTGNYLVNRLKQDVKSHCKGRWDQLELDRQFHRAFLEAGNMPVAFLRRQFAHLGLLPGSLSLTYAVEGFRRFQPSGLVGLVR